MRPITLSAILPALLLLTLPATAEVALSGEAKMGLAFDGQDVSAISGTRLTAHAYGVTDGGMEYGAVLDLDQTRSRIFNNDPPRGYVYISGGNHKLQVGTGTDSAAKKTIGTLPKPGL